ncbi:MAG TPA: VCBS repeat-containing protein [Gemmataceae bacterium]|nr:VCBS repeat-containing protein [Gemmataceae bacterium]
MAGKVGAENGVHVLLGNGDGTFQHFLRYPVNPPVTMVALADFNHDGIPDIAVAAGTINRAAAYSPRDTLVLLSKGDGTFSSLQDYTAGMGYPNSVAVGDFNGDGFPDLAVATGNGVTVLLNAADWGR